MNTFKIETSQGNETVIETLGNFGNVSSVRNDEAVLDCGTQSENEMQFWTQNLSDKTNKEVTILRKEMDEKLETVLLKEIKIAEEHNPCQAGDIKSKTPLKRELQNT